VPPGDAENLLHHMAFESPVVSGAFYGEADESGDVKV
jgi:hypothetical protein